MYQPPIVDPVRNDTDTLRSLAVGFKIMGWIHGIGACAGLLFIPVWAGVLASGFNEPQGGREASIFASGIVLLVAAMLVFLPLLYLWTSLKTAKNLELRTGWGFCFGTSILWLFVQPLGLVLGIIAIVLLHRPSIRQSFSS